ncbi:phage tail protein [Pseudomonas sp. GM17]|uniref:phage tail protein n=1 Tax=Pseudomonas sp. GM17 TaxID=1144323 RepID=UPI0024DFA567|nr:phage tail protein [Pseudomonas sp. GM17]WIE52400.1 phage tail protein [Pseudomonas sp. GM17]
MTDQNTQFYCILTAVGKAKQANATALGIPWTFAQMGVGDANGADPTPTEQQTQLINERRRAPLNQVMIDPNNANVIIAEQIIPDDAGPWWIRETGLYDAAGDLVAVGKCPPTYKPLLSQGSNKTQVIRMNLIVSNTANIELKIDPSVVLASRAYVDAKVLEEINKLDSKQSVRAATTANIALAGLQTVDGIALVAGDRVLVKNQAAAKDNGLYVAAAGAWARTADADSNAEVTSAMLVAVEQGATLADTRWQLVTDGAIVLGTTALTFQNVTQGFAPINSPALVNPTGNTPALFDSSLLLPTTEFVSGVGLKFGPQTRHYNGAAQLVLTPLDVGSMISFNGNATQTAKLPPTASLPPGATVRFIRSYAGPSVLTTISSDDGVAKIDAQAGGLVSSFSLQGGEDVFATWSGVAWILSGSYTFRINQMSGLLGGNTWQRLPGGLIQQFGSGLAMANDGNDGSSAGVDTYITFPIAFPNVCVSVVGTHYGHKASLSVITRNHSNTRFTAETSDSNVQSIRYMAVGY